MSTLSMQRRRARFRPAEIPILFIGESPPAGGTFFYFENSMLYDHTRQAFQAVFPKEDWDQPGAFLEFFQARGCYLEDLSHEPLNELGPADRASARAQCVAKLARWLRSTHPETIICVMHGVREEVQRAVALAGLSNVEFSSVPFPAQGHQRQYEDGLIKILRRCKRRGLLGGAEVVRTTLRLSSAATSLHDLVIVFAHNE